MITSRTILIHGKVFGPQDLLKLAKFTSNSYSTLTTQPRYLRKSFDVSVSSAVQYSTDQYNDLLSERLRDSPVTGVEFESRGSSPDSKLRIRVSHGSSDILNRIEIEAEDDSWVTTTFAECERILDSVQPQTRLPQRLAPVVFAISLIFLIYTAKTIAVAALSLKPWDHILGWILGTSVAVMPALGLTYAFLTLWSSVEIANGPEHKRQQIARRKRLWAFTSIAILPILSNLVSSWITSATSNQNINAPTQELRQDDLEHMFDTAIELTSVQRDARYNGLGVTLHARVVDTRPLRGRWLVIMEDLPVNGGVTRSVTGEFSGDADIARLRVMRRGELVYVTGRIERVSKSELELIDCALR